MCDRNLEECINITFFCESNKTGVQTYGMLTNICGNKMSNACLFEWCRRHLYDQEGVDVDPKSGRPKTTNL